MTRRHPRLRRAAGLVLACTLVSAPAASAVTLPGTPVQWVEEPPASWPSPPPASAQAYVLVDATTGQVLAQRAPDEARVIASTIKLLTVLTAMEVLELDDQVVVGPAADVGEASTSTDPGETRTVAELLDAVLVRSGNDAAMALASAAADGDVDAFVDQMRAVAAELGLDGITVEEPTGLDDTNLASARHLAVLARAALADPRLRAAAGKAEVTLPDVGTVPTRNLLLGSYEGATGLKTGFTTLAGYCLVATAERDGRELVAVVLGAREDPARFEEAAALLDHGFETLTATDQPALEARLPDGWATLVPEGRAWAPGPVTTRVAGTVDALEVTMVTDGDEVVGRAAVDVPPAEADGVGGALAAAAYRAMRRAHLTGTWPDGAGAVTAPASSG